MRAGCLLFEKLEKFELEEVLLLLGLPGRASEAKCRSQDSAAVAGVRKAGLATC